MGLNGSCSLLGVLARAGTLARTGRYQTLGVFQMRKANIAQQYDIQQARQESRGTMQGRLLTKALHTVIREYGQYTGDNYHVDINSLDHVDKVLLLSNYLDPSDYEWASENPTRFDMMFKEYKSHLQHLIDLETYEVFCEDMAEMGMYAVQCRDNGESIWFKR